MDFILSIYSVIYLVIFPVQPIKQGIISDFYKKTNCLKTSNLDEKYDTIIVEYWNGLNGKINRLRISEGNLKVYCNGTEVKTDVNDKNIQDKIILFIDQFYVKKTDSIVLERRASADVLVSNYSSITVKVSNSKGNVVNRTIYLGSELYKIEFHPDYLEFYDIIKLLTGNC
jgi:hypothetical protein